LSFVEACTFVTEIELWADKHFCSNAIIIDPIFTLSPYSKVVLLPARVIKMVTSECFACGNVQHKFFQPESDNVSHNFFQLKPVGVLDVCKLVKVRIRREKAFIKLSLGDLPL